MQPATPEVVGALNPGVTSREDLVLVETSEENPGIVTLTLNRPAAKNALSRQLMIQLSNALDDLQSRCDVSVVVLTGHKNFFSAGADIGELNDVMHDPNKCERYLSLWDCVTRFSKPIICAVSGYAIGGGFELALMCDLILCSERSVFSLPEIRLGLFPGAGGTQRLTRCVGKYRALSMMLTAERISADKAMQMGIVSRVCPEHRLLPDAMQLASSLAQKSRAATAHIKQLVIHASENGCMSSGLRLERSLFCSLLTHSTDVQQNITNFLQQRQQHRE